MKFIPTKVDTINIGFVKKQVMNVESRITIQFMAIIIRTDDDGLPAFEKKIKIGYVSRFACIYEFEV